MDTTAMRWKLIEEFPKTQDSIMNAEVRALCGVSVATSNRILAGLVLDETVTKLRIALNFVIIN